MIFNMGGQLIGWGKLLRGTFVRGSYLQEFHCPDGFCPAAFCQGAFDLEPNSDMVGGSTPYHSGNSRWLFILFVSLYYWRKNTSREIL